MSDNITLPREVVQEALEALGEETAWFGPTPKGAAAITALRTYLAAEQPKHPGYVIGSHWLETAYSRICAGEAEADVLRDCGWERVDGIEALRRDAERYNWVLKWLMKNGLLSRERCRIDSPASYGNWWILRKPRSIDGGSFVAYGADLRDTIDAAMEASTAPAAVAADASTAPEDKP